MEGLSSSFFLIIRSKTMNLQKVVKVAEGASIILAVILIHTIFKPLNERLNEKDEEQE